MHSLPVAGKLANDLLVKEMNKTSKSTRAQRLVTFTLVVDDFGIKFKGDKHPNYLKIFWKNSKVTVD